MRVILDVSYLWLYRTSGEVSLWIFKDSDEEENISNFKASFKSLFINYSLEVLPAPF
jgi:hypothetical protein